MANLGDYIGQILSEVTLARVQADIEAVRLADMYATHPLLKTFPVPRFRLPTVTINVPVAISDAPAATKAGAPRAALNVAQMQKAFETALNAQFKRGGLKLPAAARARVVAAARERFSKLAPLDALSTSAVHVADTASAAVSQALADVKAGAKPDARADTKADARERDQFVEDLRAAARMALIRLLPTPARMRVVTSTAKLRELGPEELLMRVRIDITEQGMEWRGEDAGGKRLMPE